jgi:hypothetical protein
MESLTPEAQTGRYRTGMTAAALLMALCALLTMVGYESAWPYVALIPMALLCAGLVVVYALRLRSVEAPPPTLDERRNHERLWKVFAGLTAAVALIAAAVAISLGIVMHWAYPILLFFFLWFAIVASSHWKSARSLRGGP